MKHQRKRNTKSNTTVQLRTIKGYRFVNKMIKVGSTAEMNINSLNFNCKYSFLRWPQCIVHRPNFHI